MKKGTGEFRAIEVTKSVCDKCMGDVKESSISYDYRRSDGYDSYGDDVEFCSLECFHKWISEYNEGDNSFIFPSNENVSISGSSELIKSLLGIEN